MLGNRDAVATVAVTDLAAAKRFYGDVLGLEPVATMGNELVVYRSGATTLNVYHSAFAGTNRATAVTWLVGNDLDDLVEALRARGVRFEHYDLPGMTREGDVHVGGGMRVAWFTDPDGNIHNLANGEPHGRASKGRSGKTASKARSGRSPVRRPTGRAVAKSGQGRKAGRG